MTWDWGPLHVTLWDKVQQRRVYSASYSGNLDSFLRTNPHLEIYNRQDFKLQKPDAEAGPVDGGGQCACAAAPGTPST